MARRIGWLLVLALVVCGSAGSADARGRSHRFPGHHGFRRHHRFFASHVFIAPSVVAPFGPYWEPYWDPYRRPYAYPPVIAAPSAQVYVQLSPSWYACDNPQGYYPYVPQCPGGWRQVAPTPPEAASQQNPSGGSARPRRDASTLLVFL